MQPITRILVALTILLSGAALLPFVDVPAATFEWQRYAGVYEEPELVVNYPSGQPGSFFHFSGAGFGADQDVTVSSNGDMLGMTTTDSAGNLEFNLNSDGAGVGSYYISVAEGNTTRTLRVFLWADAPLRPQEGQGDEFLLPTGSAIQEILLPSVVK
ncbi:MAG: hypothetical protein H6636_02810 [Anaerolineales bacterium]|nr:hypothetical protein [Anaerolineales bacterium]